MGGPAPLPAPEVAPGTTGGSDLAWADVLRVVAILMVVLIHSSGPQVKAARPGSWDWIFSAGLDSFSSAAVPVFALLSGALLLGSGRQESLSSFYRRRFMRVGVPTLFWVPLYLLFRREYLHENLSPRRMVDVVVGGLPYYHLYFLFVILGLYAVTPVLRVLIASATRQQLWLTVGIALFVTWANNASTMLLRIGSGAWALTYFLPYLGYFLLGYLARTWRPSRRDAVLAAGVFVGAWLLQLAEVYALLNSHHIRVWAYPMTKFSETTMAMTVALVVVGQRWWPLLVRGDRSRRAWRALAGASFAVYLAHPLLLAWLMRNTSLGPVVAGPRDVAITAVVTTVVMFAAGLVAVRIPVVRRLV